MKHYAQRGMEVLREKEYFAHVLAMTAEGLHSKADIAAELAVRDIAIRRLQGQLRAIAAAGCPYGCGKEQVAGMRNPTECPCTDCFLNAGGAT